MIAFDFFCGAGGLTHGLLDAGINVVASFDLDGSIAVLSRRLHLLRINEAHRPADR